MEDFVSFSAAMALNAIFSKLGSPVNLLRVANSIRNVPTPAVHVSGVSFGSTPYFRLTVPNGIPVGVSNAANILNNVYIANLLYVHT